MRAAARPASPRARLSRPVAIAAAPMKIRKKPGAITSAISSTTPPISHSHAGSKGSPLIRDALGTLGTAFGFGGEARIAAR